MSPKYSTGGTTGDRWTTDKRRVLAEWTSKPFVGHRHRHETVEHRIVVEYTPGVGLDVTHETRSEDTGKVPDEWTPVERIEGREEYAERYKSEHARWIVDD